MVKNLPAIQETPVQSQGWEDLLMKGMANHSSILGIPWWLRICLQCRGPKFDPWVGKIHWRREWLPTLVSLPGEFHGQRNLAEDPGITKSWTRLSNPFTDFFLHCLWHVSCILHIQDISFRPVMLQLFNRCQWQVTDLLDGTALDDHKIHISSVQISRSVMSDSLRPHESQHVRPPCPSPIPGVHWDSRPLSQWCHPAISSSVVPFSSCPQSLPASESFPMSQLFTWGGQVLEFQL